MHNELEVLEVVVAFFEYLLRLINLCGKIKEFVIVENVRLVCLRD